MGKHGELTKLSTFRDRDVKRGEKFNGTQLFEYGEIRFFIKTILTLFATCRTAIGLVEVAVVRFLPPV